MESTPTGEETLEAGPAAVREDDEMPRGQPRRRRRRVAVIAGGLVLDGCRIPNNNTRRATAAAPSLMTTSYVRRYTVGDGQQGELAYWGRIYERRPASSRRITCQPGRYRPTGPRTTISKDS